MTDVAAATASAIPPANGGTRSAWHDPGGFGFRDILDIVNPLQHLPVISSIYRWLTGDRPGEAAKIAGDALYGGPIGVAVGVVSAIFEDKQGHDVGERALAAVFGPGEHGTAVAEAPAPAASVTAKANPPPAAAPPTTVAQAGQNPIVLDHPPMPLYRTAMPGAAVNPTSDPAAALRAHNAALERQIGAGARTSTSTAPIPLVPPAGALPAGRVAPALAASPPPAVPSTPDGAAPLDISQKMMDALDKYMRLEKERKAAPATPGVDLAF